MFGPYSSCAQGYRVLALPRKREERAAEKPMWTAGPAL